MKKIIVEYIIELIWSENSNGDNTFEALDKRFNVYQTFFKIFKIVKQQAKFKDEKYHLKKKNIDFLTQFIRSDNLNAEYVFKALGKINVFKMECNNIILFLL